MKDTKTAQNPRREILKKAAYLAPVVLSLPAVAAFAKGGSGGRPPRRR
jgi:hypothetical protein